MISEAPVLVGAAAAITSLVTACLGLGGGMLLLALLGQVLEPKLLIPVHGVGQLFSNAGRAWCQRKFVRWGYLRWFLVGSACGAVLFIPLVAVTPAWLGSVALGMFVLVATWRPQWLLMSHWQPMLSGGFTSGLSVLFGATGPLVMSVLPTAEWERRQVVGTHAAAMTFQHGIKVAAFTLIGFNVMQHWELVIALLVGSIVGNVIGSKLLQRWSDERFRIGLRIVLTALALRMIWVGATTVAWPEVHG